MDSVTRPRGYTLPGGYTLMELLIAIAVLMIVLLAVVPNYWGTTRRANEANAIQSLKAIVQAEREYAAAYPVAGFTCELPALGGDPKAGPPSQTAAQLLPRAVASGKNAGYIFEIKECELEGRGDPVRVTGFVLTAVPETVGKTGHRGFCTDPTGKIKVDLAGGAKCTQELR